MTLGLLRLVAVAELAPEERIGELRAQVAHVHRELRCLLLAGASTADLRVRITALQRDLANLEAQVAAAAAQAEAQRRAEQDAQAGALVDAARTRLAGLLASLEPPPCPAVLQAATAEAPPRGAR